MIDVAITWRYHDRPDETIHYAMPVVPRVGEDIVIEERDDLELTVRSVGYVIGDRGLRYVLVDCGNA